MSATQPLPDIPKLIEQARESRKRRSWVQVRITIGILVIIAFYVVLFYNKASSFHEKQIKNFSKSELGIATNEVVQRRLPEVSDALVYIGNEAGPIYYQEIRRQLPEFQPRFEKAALTQWDQFRLNLADHVDTHHKDLEHLIEDKNLKLRDTFPELRDKERVDVMIERLSASIKVELVVALNREFDQHIELVQEIQGRVERIGKSAPASVKQEDDLVLIGRGLELIGAGLSEPLKE